MSENNQSNDPRFSKFYSDPKFRNAKNKDLKVKLDSRFSKKDLEVKKKAKVDKYGRRIEDSGLNAKDSKDFDKYFEKDEENKEGADVEEKEEEQEEVVVVDRARGEVPNDYVSSSDEFTSSDSESSESEVDSEEEEEDIENQSQPEVGEPSSTLAVVNLDWDHVKSSDLMITFTSFVPRGGKIEKICIFPSEFGKERMQREETEGPPRDIFQKKKSKKKSKGKKHSENSDEESDVSDVDINDLYEEGDAEKDVDTKALRQYQLERLRYYYAVVYCNNIDTARAIYENCDATEYESTANMFDIRYVPEGMEFDDEPRDQCDSLPKNYKPLNFSTDALQHSNVKLTWDETPADRVEIAKRAFSQKEIDEMDFKAYLASDSEDEEEEVDDSMKNKLKALANSTFVSNSFSKSKPNDEGADNDSGDDKGVDMEITFTPGLDENAKVTDDEKEEESTIDKIKRKEKERRKARKEKVKQLKQNAHQEKKDKLKYVKGKKGKHVETEEDAKAKAELELLMMDEDEGNSKSTINNKAHFNMNEILRSEKEKKKRSKFQNRERIVEDEFKPNLDDDRFNEIFEDRDFAIDPSQPDFKETAAMKTILEERSKRSRGKGNGKNKNNHSSKGKKRSSNDDNEKSDISNIVSKLKKHKK
ncbi:pre-rRNA-processing protein Esf1p [Monosporozyma servazzii]